MSTFVSLYFWLKRKIILIIWISILSYIFYSSFVFYRNGLEFARLRKILGLGFCISRASATVLNLCAALILLPLCKKLNSLLFWTLSRVFPKLFFFWLEKAKSFHMAVAITLVLFSVIHSISHLINLWNFSVNFDDQYTEVNFASYKYQNPINLLLTLPGLTGATMLMLIFCMAFTSLKVVRKKFFNVFWMTHHCYLPFLILLIVHPLSGALRQEVLSSSSSKTVKFIPIESKTWLFIAIPVGCFVLDMIWRLLTRNTTKFKVMEVIHMPGRTMSITISCPRDFRCRIAQYVLLQFPKISVIEWHPFTVVQIPTINQYYLKVWIRVKGDWTESLEKLLLNQPVDALNILVDGPFCSAMESTVNSDICICVAAGVGITPFVSLLHNMQRNPKESIPKRLHLIWIVRYKDELSWISDIVDDLISKLYEANKPDRLHVELYVTDSNKTKKDLIIIDNIDDKHKIIEDNDEMRTLITPQLKRAKFGNENAGRGFDSNIDVEKCPLLSCRIKSGRPHWDRVFGSWIHLYPGYRLNLYCCGPKKLTKTLKTKSYFLSRSTKTRFRFIHEGF